MSTNHPSQSQHARDQALISLTKSNLRGRDSPKKFKKGKLELVGNARVTLYDLVELNAIHGWGLDTRRLRSSAWIAILGLERIFASQSYRAQSTKMSFVSLKALFIRWRGTWLYFLDLSRNIEKGGHVNAVYTSTRFVSNIDLEQHVSLI